MECPPSKGGGIEAVMIYLDERLTRIQTNSKRFIEWDERAKNQAEWCDSRHIGLAKEGAKLVG
jgi:hypothetical protein